MQDEVNTKVVAIMIKGGKISAEVLKKALDKFVQEIEKAQKQIQQPKTYRGKQSIKHLMSQNAAISNIEVTDGNIKSFERTASKYGLDFALKKDVSVEPPSYLVFFKGRDVKDTSNKIKAIFKSRMKDGMRCSGSIPYGYKRTKEDKQQLLVDEPAAEVVRKIFRLACQGIGVTAIAEMLSAEKILIPSAYAARYFPENCRHSEVADPYRWSATTVGYILDRQEYLGHTVLGKSICENFKTKQRRAATADELMIFPDPCQQKRHGGLPFSQ